MTTTLRPGDRVGYRAKFCRAIMADPDTANRRGTVVAVLDHPRAPRVSLRVA